MTRIMGIDYGNARIGIAFSDYLHILATGFATYNRTNPDLDLKYLCDLIKEKEVGLIVIGLPLNMQGEEQQIAKETKQFGKILGEISKTSVIYYDERLTSQIANDILKKSGYDWKKRKSQLDMLAAEIILQDYLDSKKE